MQLQCLQKALRETQGQSQAPGISHSSQIYAGLELSVICYTWGTWTDSGSLFVFSGMASSVQGSINPGTEKTPRPYSNAKKPPELCTFC